MAAYLLVKRRLVWQYKGKRFVAARIARIAVPDTLLDPREVRTHARLTQAEMASLMGMSLSGYRKWEQGQRRVSGPAVTLLRVIEKETEAVRRALAG